jgi:hypothetical protein
MGGGGGMRTGGDPGGEAAGRLYGLKILQRNVEDQKDNYTRFLVVAKKPSSVDIRIPCKTSLAMATAHEETMVSEAKTMVPVTKTMVPVTKTMVSITKTMVSVTKTMVSVTNTMVWMTPTMVSEAKTMVTATQKMLYIDLKNIGSQ